MNQVSTFDISLYLASNETIVEYLSKVLESGDIDELLEAMGNIAKAKGIAQIAKDTGLGHESLYKTFQPGAKPRFKTVMKVFNSFGVKLAISDYAIKIPNDETIQAIKEAKNSVNADSITLQELDEESK